MSNERVKYNNLSIERLDGYSLDSIKDESIDKIVTDPPWGASNEVENLKMKYEQMLNSFYRVIKQNGILILLTSQGELVDTLLKKVNFKLFHKYQVNVGGRGSYVYKLKK
jgi:tRNA G10  N-methylase Trm11